MKITFITPSMGRVENSKYIKTWLMEPLPIAQLAGLTPDDIEIDFFDDRLENINFNIKTDLVAITVETYTAKRAYEISKKFREKNIKVILGGFHPTLVPNEALLNSDSIVIGEAENIWLQIIEDLKNNNLQKTYKSITRPLLKSYFPNRNVYKDKKYMSISLVESARGCNFSCNFCSVSAFYNKTYNYRSIEDVIFEIKNLKSKIIFFIDDNIGADISRAKKFFEALIPLNIKWISQISTNVLQDDAIIVLMKKSGCFGVLIGFESFNINNLKQMNKSWNMGINAYESSIKKLRNLNIIVYGTFIFGYDDDTLESFNFTLDFAIRNKLYLAAFNHLVPFPGTELYERLKNENRLMYEKWWLNDNIFFGDVVFIPKHFSHLELSQMCYESKKIFYSTGSIIKRSFDFKGNCNNVKNLFNFFYLNFLFKKESRLRKGWPIGTK